MQVTTDALNAQGFFDPRYTGEFDNSSPEIRWDNAPETSRGFVLIAEDPDTRQGLFTHWLIYGIPAQIRHLPAGIPPQETLPNGIRQGTNSAGKLGYIGPLPPVGDRPHHYFFRVHALGGTPEIPSRATREQLIQAITPYIIDSAAVMGQYQRLAAKAG